VIKAILFDVGGPIDTEITHERVADTQIRAAFEERGIVVTDVVYAAASEWAIASFAPFTYSAIIWHLARGDIDLALGVNSTFHAGSDERWIFELRPGIADLLAELHARGLRLGLAANQPRATISKLDRHGIGHYFDHREVSDSHGYHKPDPRLFLRACQDLGVEPDECIMVGDRIDNDMAPAKALGMLAVLFRTGRHIGQQPRSWTEVPDADVDSVASLSRALAALLSHM
jgi:HAD superfamily hydrolase (TIGR01662 family)